MAGAGVTVLYPHPRPRAARTRRLLAAFGRLVWVLLLTLGRVLRWAWRAGRATWWVGYVVARVVLRRPRRSAAAAVAVLLGVGWVWWFSGWPLAVIGDWTLVGLWTLVLFLLIWWTAWPTSFHDGPGAAAGIVWRRWFVYGPRWETWAIRHGLVVRVGAPERRATAMAPPGVDVTGPQWMGWADVDPARLLRVRTAPGMDRLLLALPVGLTPADVARAAEGLAHASRSLGARVVVDRPGRVWVHLIRRDTLRAPVTPAQLARVPVRAAARALPGAFTTGSTVGLAVPVASTPEDVTRLLRGVPVGVTETGAVWRLRLHGVHVLFAGTTGSGKSSLLWAVMHGLADPITKGLVAVTWLDPKGGMDATPALPMAQVVDRVPDMADTLDTLVQELDARAARLATAGARGHVPSVTSPHRVVVVDELATLTALADPKTARRVEASLGALTSRGRGPGYTVVLTTVEPTKEVVRWRGLCAERVAFRLDEPSQVDMVLGDGALHRGAVCPTIPTDTPGVCYVRPDGTPDPVRARVTWLSDTDITALTRAYPAPTARTTTPGEATGDGDGEEGRAAA
jgi:S-DNA-T family DNA segregation ATPase FtsK/SpoIIIE